MLEIVEKRTSSPEGGSPRPGHNYYILWWPTLTPANPYNMCPPGTLRRRSVVDEVDDVPLTTENVTHSDLPVESLSRLLFNALFTARDPWRLSLLLNETRLAMTEASKESAKWLITLHETHRFTRLWEMQTRMMAKSIAKWIDRMQQGCIPVCS